MKRIRSVIIAAMIVASSGLTGGPARAQSTNSTGPAMSPLPGAEPPVNFRLQRANPSDVARVRAGKASPLDVSMPEGRIAHVMPHIRWTEQLRAARRAASPAGVNGNLTYGGGPVMASVLVYEIYWFPPTLQSGAVSAWSQRYGYINVLGGAWYPGHGLADILTQYYQANGSATTYIQNVGGWGGIYVDTSPFPAPGCSDVSTPGNCLSDAQIRMEITKAMNASGWTGGYNKIFLVYTPKGMGSCLPGGPCYGGAASSTGYCAYHYSFMSNGQVVIYGNLGYADAAQYCAYSASQSPNGDPEADSAFSVATHEISEAMTDPDGSTGWRDYAITGGEIGDLCSWTFGTPTWPGPNAPGNQNWNGLTLLVQEEWNNHTSSCAQVGP